LPLLDFQKLQYRLDDDFLVTSSRSECESCVKVCRLPSRAVDALLLRHGPTSSTPFPTLTRKSNIHICAGSNLALRIHICNLFPFFRIRTIPSKSHAQLWLLDRMFCWSISCFRSLSLVISVRLSFSFVASLVLCGQISFLVETGMIYSTLMHGKFYVASF
jgi:hypothetical protein